MRIRIVVSDRGFPPVKLDAERADRRRGDTRVNFRSDALRDEGGALSDGDRSIAHGRTHQGAHCAVSALVKLNVSAVQNAALLRYHAWYVRKPGPATMPREETDGPPPVG